MDFLRAFILGLVQGVTEFIPVSSSGHLELTQQLIGGRGEDFHLFLELINVGTLLALLIFFRKRIWRILMDIFKNKNWRLARNILITSVPAGILGLGLAKIIESAGFFSSLVTIAVAMAGVGILMIFVEKLPKMNKLESEEKMGAGRAFLIGLAQTLALIPGTSRSGTTIIAGRLVGLNAKAAAEYSFLASIPISVGVCLKTLVSSRSLSYVVQNWQALAFSNLVAFLFGLIALQFVMSFVKKEGSLKYFGIYRVVLASLIVLLVVNKVLL